MVERLTSFDATKDGKLTKDELPERMQDLIAKGDENKDGVLGRDEIRKLAEELAREEGQPGPRGPVRAGRLTPRDVERALDDLRLSGSKKEAVGAALKSCKEGLKRLEDLARADLMLRVEGDGAVGGGEADGGAGPAGPAVSGGAVGGIARRRCDVAGAGEVPLTGHAVDQAPAGARFGTLLGAPLWLGLAKCR